MNHATALVLNLAVAPLGFAILHDNRVMLCITTEQQRGSSEWLTAAITTLWPHLPKIERVVVHLGRGSYTGIRSALAFARGLALGDAALYGVSFLDSDAGNQADRLDFAAPADLFRYWGTHRNAVIDSPTTPLQPLYGIDKYA